MAPTNTVNFVLNIAKAPATVKKAFPWKSSNIQKIRLSENQCLTMRPQDLCIFFLTVSLLQLQQPTETSPTTSVKVGAYFFETATPQSSQPSARFQSVGNYAATTHYLHIRLPIPFKPILDTMDNLVDNIKNKRKTDWWIDTLQVIHNHTLSSIDRTRKSLEDIISTLPQSELQLAHIQKRFIGFLLSLFGFGLGAFNGIQIQKLDYKLAKGETQTALLKDITHLHEDHLNYLDAKASLHDAMFKSLSDNDPALHLSLYQSVDVALEQQVDMVRAAVSGALQHRLAPGVYNENALESVLAYVKDLCKEHHYEQLIHHTSDLYQLETSFLYNPENQTFSTILHIPLVKKENLLQLYRFIPAPLNTDLTAGHSLAPQVGHQDLIAVNSNSTIFKVLSKTDLVPCLEIGNYHFCHGNTLLEKNMRSTCLSSIFIADALAARENCHFTIMAKREAVFPMDNNQFQIYTAETLYVTEACKESKRNLQLNNGDTLTLKSGCKAYTQDHLLLAEEKEDIQLETGEDIRAWTWNVTHLFPNVSSEAFEAALKNLKANGFHNVDATDLLHQLDIVAAKPVWTYFSWAYLVPVVILVLMMMCILFLLIKFCCSCQQRKSINWLL